jgi:hypothetical protein
MTITEQKERAIKSIQDAYLQIFGSSLSYSMAERELNYLVNQDFEQDISKGKILRQELRSILPDKPKRKTHKVIDEIRLLSAT